MAEFEIRVQWWAAQKLGLALNAIVYNIYIVPVLEYVAQLLEPSDKVMALSEWSLRKLASGPG
eukprot:2616248-Karenia_brevis.AAC.1